MTFSLDPKHNIENLKAKYTVKSWSIYLAVLLAVIGVLVALPFVVVNISSQSRGVIRAVKDNVSLSSVVSGRITFINLQNNQTVAKGDTLVIIAKDNLIAEQNMNNDLTANQSQIYQDLQNVLNGRGNSLSTPLIREEYYRYQSQRNELLSKQQQAQTNFDRHKTLYDKGVIALAEFEKYSFELDFAKKALQSFGKQQQANWQNRKNELLMSIKNYQGSNQKIAVEAQNYVLIAPIDGTIESFVGLQAGSSIQGGQPIAYLSPLDDLIVESMVMPKDIGLIKKGQEVKFQLDAFHYNQWGLLTGKVLDIDHNISQQNNQAFFKVRCQLDNKTLSLKSGYQTQVSKGMTLTTRYMITERSLYQLLFDKVDDWLNPKIHQTTDNL